MWLLHLMQTSIILELVSHLKTLISGADVADHVKFENCITKERHTALLGDIIHSSVSFWRVAVDMMYIVHCRHMQLTKHGAVLNTSHIFKSQWTQKTNFCFYSDFNLFYILHFRSPWNSPWPWNFKAKDKAKSNAKAKDFYAVLKDRSRPRPRPRTNIPVFSYSLTRQSKIVLC